MKIERDSKGRFVKGIKLGYSFEKGHIPWNKGLKGIMPTPWNKGLIAETDERIRNANKRMVKTRKRNNSYVCTE